MQQLELFYLISYLIEEDFHPGRGEFIECLRKEIDLQEMMQLMRYTSRRWAKIGHCTPQKSSLCALRKDQLNQGKNQIILNIIPPNILNKNIVSTHVGAASEDLAISILTRKACVKYMAVSSEASAEKKQTLLLSYQHVLNSFRCNSGRQ